MNLYAETDFSIADSIAAHICVLVSEIDIVSGVGQAKKADDIW